MRRSRASRRLRILRAAVKASGAIKRPAASVLKRLAASVLKRPAAGVVKRPAASVVKRPAAAGGVIVSENACKNASSAGKRPRATKSPAATSCGVHIKGFSSLTSLNGLYILQPNASRGKPVFVKQSEPTVSVVKKWILYWNVKWRIGNTLDSEECTAQLEDVPRVMVPTEPYPFVWEALNKKTKRWQKKPWIRVTEYGLSQALSGHG